MSPKDRVLKTLLHQQIDRIPRGELLVEEAFIDLLYPETTDAPYMEKMSRLAEEAQLDLITVQIEPGKKASGVREIGEWAVKTPLFILALVDGLFWNPRDPVPFERFMLGVGKDDPSIKELVVSKQKQAMAAIRRCIEQGADGIMIGDDLAHDQGPFVSPAELEKSIFPGHERMVALIKASGKPAFLHCCGNLTQLIQPILGAGFSGLHGLSPFSGNDPLAIREQTLGRLTLMGAFELDRFKPWEVASLKAKLLEASFGTGGYILGSAGGLSVHTPLDAFRALYFDDGDRSAR